MRGIIGAAAVGCLFAISAHAESPLRGEWNLTLPSVPGYFAVMKVDAEGRVIGVDDDGRESRGYVAHADAASAEFVITERGTVSRIRCAVQSRDLLHCQGMYTTGAAFRSMLILSRTERPGPKSLITNR